MIPKTWKEFRETISDNAVRNNIPISGQFELTARCNLRCKMCYVCRAANDQAAISRELTAVEWINLAREAQKAGMLYLLLTGGEVFIRPDFQEIYEEMLKLGLRITIYTNATLITPEIAQWLGRFPPAAMEVTIYGASEQTYQKVSGDPDGFSQTLRGIDLLAAQGINLKLRTTVISDNAADHDQLVKLAEDRDLLLQYVLYISPRRGVLSGVKDSLRLSPQEITQYEIKASQTFARIVSKMKEKYDLPPNALVDQNKQKNNLVSPHYPFKCNAGRSAFWVTWFGAMTPCGTMAEPATEPLRAGFANAWKELTALCAAIPLCSECSQCSVREVCWTCPARLKSETGHFDRPASYLCEWAKLRNIYF